MAKRAATSAEAGRYGGLVLLSGGPDSSTLLFQVRKETKKPLLAMHLYTGLNANDFELAAAKSVAKAADVPLQVLDITHFVALGGNKMPTIHSEAHVLRFGTAVVLSQASALAIAGEIPDVWIALHSEDANEAVEYSPTFVKWLNGGIELIGKSTRVRAPFHDWTKAKVFKRGRDLAVPFEKTWSCLSPVKKLQCGTCGGCRARKIAIESAGIRDSTKYAF